jgi:hypothetical protein
MSHLCRSPGVTIAMARLRAGGKILIGVGDHGPVLPLRAETQDFCPSSEAPLFTEYQGPRSHRLIELAFAQDRTEHRSAHRARDTSRRRSRPMQALISSRSLSYRSAPSPSEVALAGLKNRPVAFKARVYTIPHTET